MRHFSKSLSNYIIFLVFLLGLAVEVKGQTISTGTISPATICAGSQVNVPFSYANFPTGAPKTFTAQLSDQNGSFSNPVSIGNLNQGGKTGSGIISATIPVNQVFGTGYRIRVTSPGATVTDNGSNLTLNLLSTAPNSITGTTPICSGTSIILTVSGGSLGTGASWKWYSGSCGGTSAGTGNSITVDPSTTTTYFVRAEGMCNITSCASITINVNTAPTANISGNNSPLCAGDDAFFTLTGTDNAVVTYRINSGSDQFITLSGGTETVNIENATENKTLTLVSITNGTCSQNLNVTSTITVNPLPEIGSFN
jgi:hypothetical protein